MTPGKDGNIFIRFVFLLLFNKICAKSFPLDSVPLKQIFFSPVDIGGNQGKSVFIRRDKNTGNKVNKDVTDLHGNLQYRRFWITFDGGLIRVGRYQETEPFAQWQDPAPISVHYVGFASYLVQSGDWKLHTFCDAPWQWQTS